MTESVLIFTSFDQCTYYTWE